MRAGTPLRGRNLRSEKTLVSATTLKPRSIAFVILAVVVLIGACSTSHNQNAGPASTPASPTSVIPAPKPTPAPPVGHDRIEGLVRSVSGNTIQLTQRDRTGAAVDFSPKTMVTELSSAQLSDVTHGSCAYLKAAPGSAPLGDAITAESVEISPAVAGKCPPPAVPPSGPSSGAFGIVDSVKGNTIAVTGADPTGKITHTKMTVSVTTTYTKHTITDTEAIQQGKCMAAQGATASGVLHAATIDLEPCPPMGGGRHRFHLPLHFPHLHHH
jgi:hypothetical protein